MLITFPLVSFIMAKISQMYTNLSEAGLPLFFGVIFFYCLNSLQAEFKKFNIKQETGFVKLWH